MEASPRVELSPFAYRGSAIGALFMAFFGAAWLFLGLAALGHGPLWLFALLAITPVTLIGAAIGRLKAPAPPIDDETKALKKKIGRQFGIINAIQWTAVGVGIAILNVAHRPELIVPLIVIIVALHFLPLARIFHQPIHYYSCAFLLAWVTACYCLGFSPQVLPSAIAIGTGGILWIIGAWGLSATRKFENAGAGAR